MTTLYAETADLIDTSVPVTSGGSTEWRWVHRLQLPALLAGDILQGSANAEFRNDAGYNVEFADSITLCPGWPYYVEDLWGYGGAVGSAYFVKAINGEDVSPERHYRAPSISAEFQMPADMPIAWLHFRVRARSTSANGQTCTIMGPGYGKLSCLITRPDRQVVLLNKSQ